MEGKVVSRSEVKQFKGANDKNRADEEGQEGEGPEGGGP